MTKLGVFVVPDATDPEHTVSQIVAADRAGLGGSADWLDADRIADFAGRLRLDALFVSTPHADPLGYIAALGETAAELRA